MRKVLSLIAFVALVAEATNIIQNGKGFSQFIKGIRVLKNHPFYHNYIQQMIGEKASLLEPNRNRRYFIILSLYMLKYDLNRMLVLLFYFKYRIRL